MDILEEIRIAKRDVEETKKIKCTCSGFVIQYEGGCCCKAGKSKAHAKDKLDMLVNSI